MKTTIERIFKTDADAVFAEWQSREFKRSQEQKH